HRYEYEGGTYRGRIGSLYIPTELVPIVEGVFGLDDRPQAQPAVQLVEPTNDTASESIKTSYTPLQVANLYNFPTLVDGAGQSIGIIELGGGYLDSDLSAYFPQFGIPTPQVSIVSVDGGRNDPGSNLRDDGEVTLDIEIAGAVAPGAHIIVYFAPNNSRGFIDAVTTAIHDISHKPSVISISWGGPEFINWTQEQMQLMDQKFQDAAALGITVCCITHDKSSSDGVSDGKAHVDFPGSSPHALACGGTRLESSGGTITSEVAWNSGNGVATGGGVSDVFDLPNWQVGAGVPLSINPGERIGRGVPDVAGNADPNTGYKIRLRGQTYILGGTSAVAPLLTGLIALINQQLEEPVGYLNPLLYQQMPVEADVVNDTTSGNNGGYQARQGWDACTGLGSPNGANWLAALIY
ncbi:MAG: S53 family peptidase, partial [Kovacikia sp.]